VDDQRTTAQQAVANGDPEGHARDVHADAPGSPEERRTARHRFFRHPMAVGAAAVALAFGVAALTFSLHLPGIASRVPIAPTQGSVASPKVARDRETPRWVGQGVEGRIVFSSFRGGRYHLHLIDPDGTDEIALTSGRGEEFTPAWSPDRRFIAFAGSSKARKPRLAADIYVVRSDGTGLARITHGPENEEDPSWSPDGSHIIFTASDRSTGRTRIRMASVDGSASAELPEPPKGCIDREPAWSPNGLTIAFARQCQEESSRLELVHLDGMDVVTLEGFGRTPAWSPDGAKLAYTGWGRQAPAIFVINADGTEKVQLTTDGTGDPVWSPDGSRIAFTAGGFALKLFVINIDGSEQRALTTWTENETTPSW
jgi:Tol biopolymer transport system component